MFTEDFDYKKFCVLAGNFFNLGCDYYKQKGNSNIKY